MARGSSTLTLLGALTAISTVRSFQTSSPVAAVFLGFLGTAGASGAGFPTRTTSLSSLVGPIFKKAEAEVGLGDGQTAPGGEMRPAPVQIDGAVHIGVGMELVDGLEVVELQPGLDLGGREPGQGDVAGEGGGPITLEGKLGDGDMVALHEDFPRLQRVGRARGPELDIAVAPAHLAGRPGAGSRSRQSSPGHSRRPWRHPPPSPGTAAKTG